MYKNRMVAMNKLKHESLSEIQGRICNGASEPLVRSSVEFSTVDNKDFFNVEYVKATISNSTVLKETPTISNSTGLN